MGKKWTLSKWKGMKKYNCNECPFDTLDKTTMEQHFQDEHMPVTPPKTFSSFVTDRFGNPIEKEG